jgi:hypothetical protein
MDPAAPSPDSSSAAFGRRPWRATVGRGWRRRSVRDVLAYLPLWCEPVFNTTVRKWTRRP